MLLVWGWSFRWGCPCWHPGGPSVALEYGTKKAGSHWYETPRPLPPPWRQLRPESHAHAGIGSRRQVEPLGTTASPPTSTAGIVKSLRSDAGMGEV